MGVLWSDLILLGMGMFPSREGNIKTKKKQPIYICSKSRFNDRCHAIGFYGKKKPIGFYW